MQWQMKAGKITYIYYWVIILTPLIFIFRTFAGDWLETRIYLKQHGTLNDRPVICMALPPFIVYPVLLLIVGIAFIWARSLKTRIYHKSNLTFYNYYELALITILVILPFIYIDINLITLLIKLSHEYFNA